MCAVLRHVLVRLQEAEVSRACLRAACKFWLWRWLTHWVYSGALARLHFVPDKLDLCGAYGSYGRFCCAQVENMTQKHHVYMTKDGRISLAGADQQHG